MLETSDPKFTEIPVIIETVTLKILEPIAESIKFETLKPATLSISNVYSDLENGSGEIHMRQKNALD